MDAMDTAVITEFLTDWGLNHIPNADAQVAAFITAQNLS
jgi:hemerythrin